MMPPTHHISKIKIFKQRLLKQRLIWLSILLFSNKEKEANLWSKSLDNRLIFEFFNQTKK